MPGLKVVTVNGSSFYRIMSVSSRNQEIQIQMIILFFCGCLQIATEGNYRIAADQWRADPSLVFMTREQCIEEVRKGN